ncbi:MAG: head decoration protein [Limnohabitans sp.]
MARLIYTDFNFQSVGRVTNLPTPSAAGDAVPKSYVDSLVEGLSWKDSCRVATQANTNISSPGATIDGITMVSGDRVLVRLQTTTSQNGIYVWNGAAVAMTRALDASTFAELEQAVVTVEEGTSAGVTYRQDQVNGTIDSSAVNWTSFGTAAPGASETTAGIAEIATQAEVDAGTDDVRIVTPLKLATWSGRIRKVSANIGDGTNTTYTVTHNLNTRDVIVRVFPNSGQYDDIEVDVQRTGVNTVALTFVTTPASNAFRVVVVG